MSIIGTLFRPLGEKIKDDFVKIVKGWFEKQKKNDLDHDGRADWDQICSDGSEAVRGAKITIAALTRIGALGACYYLQFNPQQTKAVTTNVNNKVAFLTDSSADLA